MPHHGRHRLHGIILAYKDRIYAVSKDGDTYVIRAGRKLEVLGVNSLDAANHAYQPRDARLT